jgi:RHH-type proline utilization regulon transcriptional repressor/proline dehydrogenase/delta 1-pyrroline-5-carboxylate dehydrogenase
MKDPNQLVILAKRINQAFIMSEHEALAHLQAYLGEYDQQRIAAFSSELISAIRAKHSPPPFDKFLHEYGLDSEEGIVLMRIAEALLRIPDSQTQNLFLQEKLADANWHRHLSHSDSALVNLATAALMLSGKAERHARQNHLRIFTNLMERMGQPVIRSAIKQVMQLLAQHFVIAENIDAAIAQAARQSGYRYSFDMLGESALTGSDADRYFQAYSQAIDALAGTAHHEDLFANPGISIKLSALWPRYEPLQSRYAIPQLSTKLLALAKLARAANISLTIDAEEAERLQMSLNLYALVSAHPALAAWHGLGLAVQAYQKRAIYVIDWLAALAETQQRIIPIRLVKGAYWDTEIKRCQENGWEDYPVFTSKAATDISYLACARRILSYPQALYPQFATHNAHSVAAIRSFGAEHPGFEFQRLHGMGAAIYDELLSQGKQVYCCRIYAPVGGYRELLPYLVRRLLENGANTSFINQIENPEISLAQLTRDPQAELQTTESLIVAPPDIFGKQRKNSQGLNLCDLELLQQWQQILDDQINRLWQAYPLVAGLPGLGEAQPVYSPFDQNHLLGNVVFSSADHVEQAMAEASLAFNDWRLCAAETRAGYLLRTSDLLEQHRQELVTLAIREGGKTLNDALAEVREAVDLCRYYAALAVEQFALPRTLPGPVGEDNRLFQYGRGTFVCISPWNFPIAIFIGQITAALVTGNTVISKPAQQTSLTAMLCIRLMHQAGIPKNVLHFLPGDGAAIGNQLFCDERIAGVVFTGSSATAHIINRQLGNRQACIIPLIAETGGQNVLIADTSAHEEQLVADVVQSAFNSAGQRCSSLRVLYLPEETADKVIARLIGAMQLLRLGPPTDITTDIGPIIDRPAITALNQHIQAIKTSGKLLYQTPLNDGLPNGFFLPPTLLEIPGLSLLEKEVFGPILHVVRYACDNLEQVVTDINASGYGLTLGIHSRIQSTISYIQQHSRVGNIYINRNMIGAVVGVQPFGGQGLSGTGPKAGGPNYLQRFTTEQTVTDNIAAIGGNPWLLTEKLQKPS